MARTSKRKREHGRTNEKKKPKAKDAIGRKWLARAALAVGIAAGIVAWQWPATLWGFKKASSFTLQSSTGRTVSLEDLRGKTEVVLIFYMGAG